MQYLAALHPQFFNLCVFVCGLLHFEQAMVLSVTVEDDVVVVLPSCSSNTLRACIAFLFPCVAAFSNHSLALVDDCSIPPLPS